MKKSRYILLSYLVVCTVILVFFISYYNKTNSYKAVLINNMAKLEEELRIERDKNKDLEEQINYKDTIIEKLKKSDISHYYSLNKEKYNWLSEAKWNRVTLTDIVGKTIDITNHELLNKGKNIITEMWHFKNGFSVNGSVAVYTYKFYYENGEEKSIAVSFDGDMGKFLSNKMLYDLGIALMPVDSSNDICTDNINYAITNTKFFIHYEDVGYDVNNIKYIMLRWIPECTSVVDKLPEDIGEPTIVFKGYLHNKISYIKAYDYNGTDTCYIECYYDGKTIYYEKLVKDNEFSIYHVLGMSL